jgi:tetratricopeptide (TPR) repeat protein
MLPNRNRLLTRAYSFVAATAAALAALSGLGLWPAAASAAESNWIDIESRIQYGYYTEDARSIAGAMEQLSAAQSADAMQNYYAALGNYRLALLSIQRDGKRAKVPVEQCVASLDIAIETRKDFADAMALQSACLDMLATLEPWRAPFAASRSGTQLEKARHLAPGNPRVLLIDAVAQFEQKKKAGGAAQRAVSELKTTAAAFEAERQQTQPLPGWGAAEAYVYLARCYLDLGHTLEARDALERALLLAPEYAQARRLMAKITTG